MKLGFIGAGNMASAIIKSLIKAESKFELLAFDVDFDKLSLLSNLGVTPCKNIANLASDSDYIVLAVKPQNIEEVLVDIKSNIKKSAVVISIAAGITAEYIKKELGYDAKVVLVMPNTPLMLGVGATALAHIAPVSDAEFNNVRNIFDCAGITAEVAS
ncbi:MAG: NAD(P)-binding domain-containing protein, partial [Oscillospiraceae bacterium]